MNTPTFTMMRTLNAAPVKLGTYLQNEATGTWGDQSNATRSASQF